MFAHFTHFFFESKQNNRVFILQQQQKNFSTKSWKNMNYKAQSLRRLFSTRLKYSITIFENFNFHVLTIKRTLNVIISMSRTHYIATWIKNEKSFDVVTFERHIFILSIQNLQNNHNDDRFNCQYYMSCAK